MLLDALIIYAAIAFTALFVGVAIYHPNAGDRSLAAGAALVFSIITAIVVFDFVSRYF